MVRTRDSGATLVELAVAVVVLSAVAGAAVWLGPAQRAGIVRAHQDEVALRAAAAWIEEYRAAPRDGPATVAFTPSGTLPGGEGCATLEPAGPGLVRVTAAVSWDAADGGRRTKRLVTLAAREEPR